NVAAEESGPPIAPVVHTVPPEPEIQTPAPAEEPSRAVRLAEARSLIEAPSAPKRRASPAAEVAGLARELTSELTRAADTNAHLEEAAQSRTALEEIHRALAEARSRIR